jgi:PAS domain S-box-containing protein
MLNSILDSMGEGVIAVAQSGHVLLFNRRARQILGMQLEGTLPVDWMARCGLRQADGRSEIPRDQDPLLRAMRGEPMLETELFVRAPKGPGTRVAVSATALLDEEGKLAGGIALLRDVTRQRSLEQQLTQAQKMEAVGRLAGGVAHDFNNLLAVILSYGELVRGETAPDGSARSDMGELIAAAQRAAGLTRQLLAFSRQQIARPQAVKLNDIGSNLEKMLRRVIGEDVELVTQYAAALGTVMADPGQIEQIIVNLAVNARDAMPQGGRLTIETANVRLDEAYAASHSGVVPGEYVRLSVRDTGTGMDAETKRQIFEPFFTTKEVGVGTGLGLSTVYGIVQQSAGRIWVDSEPGNGSTFEIYLPRVDAVEKAPERPTPVPSATKGSATILLIEDDYAVRRVAVRILRDIGYVVLDAPSAGEARRLCATHGPSIDVLLTDVVMPEIRGPALAKELSAGNPRMRVIYMSGYPGAGVVQDSVLEAGANFIEKPFSPTSLVEKVREVLAQAPG